jgi:hypothetical protein
MRREVVGGDANNSMYTRFIFLYAWIIPLQPEIFYDTMNRNVFNIACCITLPPEYL